ncbi:MAG TPA: glycosyltransferase family 39 protein [Candidatus Saccharimonadales bacterium]|nr:glycosyltransferase family 39 protein [Candidatus Saccharimonadales bacterium]
MTRKITDYFLYRWRYILGYVGIGLVFTALLVMAGFFVPGGLSEAEMRSVVASSNITLSFTQFDPSSIIDLPYHLLQRISIDLFGISNISIKLPSLILGALSTFGMLILLRIWFQRNVAVITTALTLTTGQFLYATQSGTPGIIYIFWSIWLLVSATLVARRSKWSLFWKIAFFAIAALSLYTQLSIYILIALLGAIIFHPHLRFLVRQLSKARLTLAFICSLILLIPLGYAIIKQPSVGLTLLGIPTTSPDIQANALQLVRQYFDFTTLSSGTMVTPIYGLGSAALILLGIFRLATAKYTVRSYLLTAWAVLLIPILLLNPRFINITFVPILLLIAMGISTLIGNWYQLFPRNPYARVAGLLPLAILIGGMVLSGVDRYMYGYQYDPNTVSNFSKDLSLLRTALKSNNGAPIRIVAASDEAPFYQAVAKHSKNVTVSNTVVGPGSAIVTRASYLTSKPAGLPTEIITNGRVNDADRFYLYKTDTK